MAVNSRSKGIRGELEVRDLFRAGGYKAQRGQQYAGGSDSPDVRHNIPWLHVEVKYTQSSGIWNWLAQAVRDAKGKLPVVFHRRNSKDWVVIMTADDFFRKLRTKAEPRSW